MGARVINREQWADHPELWKGEFQGGAHGVDMSVVFYATDEIGGGPRLHSHPYPETFIIRSGEAVFTVGASELRASAGQIVVVPADTPHKFRNAGPGPLETIDIHANGEFITEWLE